MVDGIEEVRMLDKVRAIIFDLDGTLIDSMWLWKQIDIDYLKRFGHELPEDLQESIEGKSFTETAQYFKNRFDIPDSIKINQGIMPRRQDFKNGVKAFRTTQKADKS